MPTYFDIHSHIDASQYDADREEVIKRLGETGTHTITIGTDLESSKRAVELARKHEGIYACIGVLAVDNPEATFDTVEFEKLVSHPKVVAIGECGLDFSRVSKEQDYERQKKVFVDQIEFAIAHDKPLMIHTRNTYEEVLEILQVYKGKARGNIHFFTGDWEVAERFFALGFTISFTGVITFARDYDEVVKKAPLNLIMSETDAPYVAPVPYRGKRNEPAYVEEVVKRIAEIRGEDLETVRAALVENALRMVG